MLDERTNIRYSLRITATLPLRATAVKSIHNPTWTALITPFHEDLSIDYDSLAKLLDEQDRAGLGLLILGSTGESLNIDLHEKMRLVEFVAQQKLEQPIMVGVPGCDLKSTLSWLKFLESMPIDAYLMVTPLYARPGHEGQYAWFSTLMDHVTRPVMLYNIPKRCGVELSEKSLARLSQHKNYWALKDASGLPEQGERYWHASEQRPIFCGDDALFPAYAKAKSVGLVSVAANAWPHAVRLMVELSLAKRFVDDDLWRNACDVLFSGVNPIAIKRLLYEEKRIATPIMMPPLSTQDFIIPPQLLSLSQAIVSWAQHKRI